MLEFCAFPAEIGAWCGVTEGAVTKWIAWSSGQEHTGYGHEPRPEHLQKLRELRREARAVADFNIDPPEWRTRAYESVDGGFTWEPVWEQFANHSCASAKHYPHDDPQAAIKDLGEALLADDDAEFNVKVRSSTLTGDAAARCFGKGEDWEVLVKKDIGQGALGTMATSALAATENL